MIRAFLASGTLAGHPWLRAGDGRITAGHLAVLADRAAAGPLELILFDGVIGADWSWSQRDAAMARRILATSPPSARTLVVAGNARTPTGPIEPGVPVGADLAGQRPGIQEIRISYGAGSFYNGEPRQFAHRTDSQHDDPGLQHRVQGVHARLLIQHQPPVPDLLHPGKQLRVRLLPGYGLDDQVQLYRHGEVILPPGWPYGVVLAASLTGDHR